jgi:hypothetical protein
MVFGASTLTTADLIRQALAHVRGASRPQINVLGENFASSSDQMVMEHPVAGVHVGQSIEVDLSTYLVAAVSTATQTLTVVAQSVAANHDAGSRVTMRPIYDKARIVTEMNNELADLSTNDLYRVEVVAADISDDIAVPAGALTILDVWSNEPNVLAGTRQLPEAHFRIVETPTGTELRGRGGPDGIRLSFVTFGCGFDTLPLNDETVNVVSVTGLWGQALDLLPLGAAVRMLMGTESQRNIVSHQGESRRAEEVPPGAVSGSLRNLAALRQGRLVAESQRFRQRFGHTKRVGA